MPLQCGKKRALPRMRERMISQKEIRVPLLKQGVFTLDIKNQ
jgi:hypothetical protein